MQVPDQRLLYCGALRAFFRPYFLRSIARGSRVRNPAFFNAGRSSGCTRISARAIGNISNIGGGGGGVYGALQSGLFRLFDTYRYDRLGIRCRLENDVCLMSGIEPVGTGYYLLKGKGLPRIDIVGNVGRVNWPQLVSQIMAQMEGEGVRIGVDIAKTQAQEQAQSRRAAPRPKKD